jgi:hypothetical protein
VGRPESRRALWQRHRPEAGLYLAWKETEGNLALTMADGKVTGWTSSGRGINTLATGDWAKLAGKGYAWTAKSIGPSQYTVEAKDK